MLVRVHEPLPEDSLITHSVVVDFFTETDPVGVAPVYRGETVTEKRCSCS
jgi:hypothetical protein